VNKYIALRDTLSLVSVTLRTHCTEKIVVLSSHYWIFASARASKLHATIAFIMRELSKETVYINMNFFLLACDAQQIQLRLIEGLMFVLFRKWSPFNYYNVHDLSKCLLYCLVPCGSWYDHTKSYLNTGDAPHVLHVKYEEIVKVRTILFDRVGINFEQRKIM